MFKRIDRYIFSQFITPFGVLFVLLFFLFLIGTVFSQLNVFLGRGLDFSILGKLIMYLGINLIRLVMPLAILFASIMTFGGLGERYELAAIKSTGTSLIRSMLSIFIFSIIMTLFTFYVVDTISTNFKKRADNLISYIKEAKVDAILQPGIFLIDENNNFPAIRAEDKKGDSLYNIYIVQQNGANMDRDIIFAKKGLLKNDKKLPIATLTLLEGHIYRDKIKNLDLNKLKKQPTEKIHFDKLITRFNLKNLYGKDDVNEEGDGSTFSSLTMLELKAENDSLLKNDSIERKTFERVSFTELTNAPLSELEKYKPVNNQSKTNEQFLYKNTPMNWTLKTQTLEAAKSSLTNFKNVHFQSRQESEELKKKTHKRYEYEMYSRFVYALECLVMFLVGAPLGSIIRKGGLGLPMVVGIVIFVIFLIIDNIGKPLILKTDIHSAIGAFLPVIVFLPFGIYLTIKANNDSQIFNLDLITTPFRKIYRKFKPEKIHKRYQ